MSGWNPSKDLAAPLDNPEPTDYDVAGLFDLAPQRVPVVGDRALWLEFDEPAVLAVVDDVLANGIDVHLAGHAGSKGPAPQCVPTRGYRLLPSNAEIAARFAVMAAGPWHRFRVLIDDLARAGEWFTWMDAQQKQSSVSVVQWACHAAFDEGLRLGSRIIDEVWPLPNLMVGTTIRTQAEADERLPLLAKLPARWRFVRVGPHEAIDFRVNLLWNGCDHCHGATWTDALTGDARCHGYFDPAATITRRERPRTPLEPGCGRFSHARAGIDLVEIAGGAGPEQLRLVQDIGRQVLDAQHGCVECKGLGFTSEPDPSDPDSTLDIRCRHETEETQREGPALAIVSADVCPDCYGSCSDFSGRGCPTCTWGPRDTWGTNGSVTENPQVWFSGRGVHQNQHPVGWRP